MSWFLQPDKDEYEYVIDSKTYGCYPGTTLLMGSLSAGWQRRSDEDIARIKAEKLAKAIADLRIEEDNILIRAEEIKARRANEPKPGTILFYEI